MGPFVYWGTINVFLFFFFPFPLQALEGSEKGGGEGFVSMWV